MAIWAGSPAGTAVIGAVVGEVVSQLFSWISRSRAARIAPYRAGEGRHCPHRYGSAAQAGRPAGAPLMPPDLFDAVDACLTIKT